MTADNILYALISRGTTVLVEARYVPPYRAPQPPYVLPHITGEALFLPRASIDPCMPSDVLPCAARSVEMHTLLLIESWRSSPKMTGRHTTHFWQGNHTALHALIDNLQTLSCQGYVLDIMHLIKTACCAAGCHTLKNGICST